MVVGDAAAVAFLRERPRAFGGRDVERGEEEVLEYGAVVEAVLHRFWAETLEEAVDGIAVEKRAGDEAALADEPNEEKARDEADDGLRKLLAVVRRVADHVGEADLRLRGAGPLVPLEEA